MSCKGVCGGVTGRRRGFVVCGGSRKVVWPADTASSLAALGSDMRPRRLRRVAGVLASLCSRTTRPAALLGAFRPWSSPPPATRPAALPAVFPASSVSPPPRRWSEALLKHADKVQVGRRRWRSRGRWGAWRGAYSCGGGACSFTTRHAALPVVFKASLSHTTRHAALPVVFQASLSHTARHAALPVVFKASLFHTTRHAVLPVVFQASLSHTTRHAALSVVFQASPPPPPPPPLVPPHSVAASAGVATLHLLGPCRIVSTSTFAAVVPAADGDDADASAASTENA